VLLRGRLQCRAPNLALSAPESVWFCFRILGGTSPVQWPWERMTIWAAHHAGPRAAASGGAGRSFCESAAKISGGTFVEGLGDLGHLGRPM